MLLKINDKVSFKGRNGRVIQLPIPGRYAARVTVLPDDGRAFSALVEELEFIETAERPDQRSANNLTIGTAEFGCPPQNRGV